MITGNDKDNVLTGGMGADMLDGGGNPETDAMGDTANYADSMMGVTVSLAGAKEGDPGTGMGGTAEGDTLKNIENVTGSDHADMLIGDDGNNTLTGGAGDDLIKGGLGDDTLAGGLGHDTLVGGKGDDTLTGGEGNDMLDGCTTGKDTIDGGEGNDVLRGRSDADMLTGGAGNDTAIYDESEAGVTVNLMGGLDHDDDDGTPMTVHGMGGTAHGDTLTSIENVKGTNMDDSITGDGEANMLYGLDGDDTIMGMGGADMLDRRHGQRHAHRRRGCRQIRLRDGGWGRYRHRFHRWRGHDRPHGFRPGRLRRRGRHGG